MEACVSMRLFDAAGQEVFKQDSLDTLSSAPVTEKHDVGMISPKNIKGNSIGYVSERIDLVSPPRGEVTRALSEEGGLQGE